MKQQERHRLKQDDLAFGLHRLVNFGRQFGRQLAILGIVIVALALVYVGLQFVRGQSRQKESRAIGEVLKLRADLPKTPANLAKLEAYKGKAGRLAEVLIGTYWVEQGDLDKAEAAVLKVTETPKDTVYYEAQDLLAQIYFWRKNYDKAIEIYKNIVNDNPKEYPLDGVIYHQAEALEKKGQKAEALTLYKKLQTEYAQTYFGYESQAKIASLEAVK